MGITGDAFKQALTTILAIFFIIVILCVVVVILERVGFFSWLAKKLISFFVRGF